MRLERELPTRAAMIDTLRTCTLLLTVATAAIAQSASYTVIGTPCTTGRLLSWVGPVPLSVQGVPRLGTTFTVVTECSASYPPGQRRTTFLLTGASNTSAGGLPLPFDLATLSPPGSTWCGMLGTSIDVMERVAPQPDFTTPGLMPIAVPNLAALAGARFFQQVVSIERDTFGSPRLGVSLSALGQGVIGL